MREHLLGVSLGMKIILQPKPRISLVFGPTPRPAFGPMFAPEGKMEVKHSEGKMKVNKHVRVPPLTFRCALSFLRWIFRGPPNNFCRLEERPKLLSADAPVSGVHEEGRKTQARKWVFRRNTRRFPEESPKQQKEGRVQPVSYSWVQAVPTTLKRTIPSTPNLFPCDFAAANPPLNICKGTVATPTPITSHSPWQLECLVLDSPETPTEASSSLARAGGFAGFFVSQNFNHPTWAPNPF